MEELVDHVGALERIWSEIAPTSPPSPSPSKAERRFPDDGGWYWVQVGDGPESPVVEPVVVSWLDGRFRVVEKVYRAHALLRPRLRGAGESAEPRGVEMWEWSCIGMHRLWDGWSDPDGVVRADLRPALFDVVGEDAFESETMQPYELYYPKERVEAVAVALGAAPTPRRRALWHRTLADAVARSGLEGSRKPSDLLVVLEKDGLARRVNGRVAVRAADDTEAFIAVSTFRKTARLALDRQLFERFV